MPTFARVLRRFLSAAMLVAAPVAAAQSAGTASTMVVSRVDPAMPAGITGQASASCAIVFQVGTEGAPGPVAPAEVTVNDCEEPYKSAAAEAAAQWRFEPNLLGGKAYPYKYTARLDFRHTTEGHDLKHRVAAGVESGGGSGGVVVSNRALPHIPDDWQQQLRAEGLPEIHWRVRIQVAPTGVPASAEVLEAPAFLRRSLMDAAMMWSFEPIVVEGIPQPFAYTWEQRWVPL